MIGNHFCWKEIIMQLKLTTEYAIRIALYLAEQNGVCTSKEIAEYTQISPNYVLKILRVLAKYSTMIYNNSRARKIPNSCILAQSTTGGRLGVSLCQTLS